MVTINMTLKIKKQIDHT